jgi:hypothetical protein
MSTTLLTDDAAAWVASYERGEAARAVTLATHVALMGYVPHVDPTEPVRICVERQVDGAVWTATAERHR